MIWNTYNGPILLGLFLPLLESVSRFYLGIFNPTQATVFLLSTYCTLTRILKNVEITNMKIF